MDKITEFKNEYRWLSNFWPCDVPLADHIFASVEHAYQWAKTDDFDYRTKILNAITPGEAKKLGRKCHMRPDWDSVKVSIMRELLETKFCHNIGLGRQLLATGDTELIEQNFWHDITWGRCMCQRHNGEGQNMLGKLLMELRDKGRAQLIDRRSH